MYPCTSQSITILNLQLLRNSLHQEVQEISLFIFSNLLRCHLLACHLWDLQQINIHPHQAQEVILEWPQVISHLLQCILLPLLTELQNMEEWEEKPKFTLNSQVHPLHHLQMKWLAEVQLMICKRALTVLRIISE